MHESESGRSEVYMRGCGNRRVARLRYKGGKGQNETPCAINGSVLGLHGEVSRFAEF